MAASQSGEPVRPPLTASAVPAPGAALRSALGLEWVVVAIEFGARGVLASVRLIARKYAVHGQLDRAFSLAAEEFRIFCAFLGIVLPGGGVSTGLARAMPVAPAQSRLAQPVLPDKLDRWSSSLAQIRQRSERHFRPIAVSAQHWRP